MAGLDEAVLRALNRAGEVAAVDLVMVSFTVLGALAVTLLVSPFLWAKGRKGPAVDLVAAVLVTSLLVELVKLVWLRDRLFVSLGGTVHTISFYGLAEATGPSFPSGHAGRAFAVAAVLSRQARSPWLKGGVFAIAALTGVSRIYLGLHWPSDVLVGSLVGLCAGLALTTGATARQRAYARFRAELVSALERLIDGVGKAVLRGHQVLSHGPSARSFH